MSDAEDMSFEVLGASSMLSADGNSTGPTSSMRNPSLLNSALDSEISRMRLSSTNGAPRGAPGNDVALDILLRRKTPSADLLQNFKLPSLSAEFPSLSNANLTEEDFSKLQIIIAEHQQLKENLLKANTAIRGYFTALEKWQTEIKRSKNEDQRTISLLTANNQKLQQELQRLQSGDTSTTPLSLSSVPETESLRLEVQKLRQELSESKEAAKEMIPKNVYKNVERQCSQLLAENLQFKDMEQQYVDTINCLKVNHASTEELVRMGQADLNAERAATHKIMQELNNVKEENQVLIQQAEIYQKDFIAEREARQRMAGEKEEVLTELNRLRMMLQQPPMQMQVPLPTQAPPHFGLVRFTCPGCYSQFNSQQLLSQHMPQCGRQN